MVRSSSMVAYPGTATPSARMPELEEMMAETPPRAKRRSQAIRASDDPS
jgi:hypothetical protein